MAIVHSDREFMFEYANLDWITLVVVQNTWYIALAEIPNVKAWYIMVEQENDGAGAETIELEVTIDGTPIVATAALASGTRYYYILDLEALASLTATAIQVLAFDADQSAPLETRSIAIRVRQTTPVDVVSAQLEVNMVYATQEETT